MLIFLLLLCGRIYAFEIPHRLPAPGVKMKAMKSSQSDALEDEAISSDIKDLMSKHDPILLFASKLLPPATAKDASALYAWCRRLDYDFESTCLYCFIV